MRVHLLSPSNKDERKHYQGTILNHSSNCKTKEIKKHVGKIITDALSEKSCALWGVKKDGKNGLLNKNRWLKIQPNDLRFLENNLKFDSEI